MFPTETPEISAALIEKRGQLIAHLAKLQSVIVAYSGGVDSSVLAYFARLVLGGNARIVIALSPSLARAELDAARLQAKQFDFDLLEIETDEVGLDDYRRNDSMRCFFCKSTLFQYLQKIKEELALNAIAYGAIMDDLADVRPGHQAAAQYNVAAPLLECRLYKSEIRALAAAVGLPCFDRPQAACLSSRFPTNVTIDPQRLASVDGAEEVVRSLGFRQVRVRFRPLTAGPAIDHMSVDASLDTGIAGSAGPVVASVEIGEDELSLLKDYPEKAGLIEAALRALGFSQVLIDPRGYGQGGADNSLVLASGKGLPASGPEHG